MDNLRIAHFSLFVIDDSKYIAKAIIFIRTAFIDKIEMSSNILS